VLFRSPEKMLGPDSALSEFECWIEHMSKYKKTAEELGRLTRELKDKVKEGTSELIKVNKELRIEVDKHRETLKELAESRQRHSLHIQQTPLAVIEWDTDFKVLEWNPGAEKMFGYLQEEATGRHASFIIPEIEREHVDMVWKGLISQRGGRRSTNKNIRKDGKIIICEWYNTPLVDSEGKVIGVASLVQDITERMETEEELEKYREKLEELVSIRTEDLKIVNEKLRIKLAQEPI